MKQINGLTDMSLYFNLSNEIFLEDNLIVMTLIESRYLVRVCSL